jgi:hypothetical protein
LVLSRVISNTIKEEVDLTTIADDKPPGLIEEFTIEFVKIADQEVNLGSFGKYHTKYYTILEASMTNFIIKPLQSLCGPNLKVLTLPDFAVAPALLKPFALYVH